MPAPWWMYELGWPASLPMRTGRKSWMLRIPRGSWRNTSNVGEIICRQSLNLQNSFCTNNRQYYFEYPVQHVKPQDYFIKKNLEWVLLQKRISQVRQDQNSPLGLVSRLVDWPLLCVGHSENFFVAASKTINQVYMGV